MLRNPKLRSLVLTVLLVASVAAGTHAGSVAAAGNVAGEPPGVHTATHYTDAAGDPVLELAFTESIDTASVNETTRMTLTLDNGTTLPVYDDGYQGGFAPRTRTADRLVVDTGGTTYDSVANLTIEGIRDTDGDVLDSETVEVRYAATTADTAGGAEVTAYRGANVTLVRGTAVGTTFDIEGQDNLTYDTTRGTGPNSELFVWETAERPLGTYTVSDGTDSVDLTLQSLGLTVALDEAGYETDETVTGTVEAADIDRDVTVELVDGDGDVARTRTVRIGDDGTADFAFESVGAANYTVEARDRDTQVTASSEAFAVVDAGTPTAEFGSPTYSEARGDVVTLTVTLAATDTATVQIGDYERDNYNLTAEVVDEDGDGVVELTFDSLAAGHDGSSPDDVVEVEGEDRLTAVEQGGPFTTGHPGEPGEALLDAAEYDLAVEAGEMDDTTVTEADDVGTLSLAERSTGNITVWTAPENDFNSMDDLVDVLEFREEGALTRQSSLAAGDLLVVAVAANGLEGAFDDTGEFQRVSEAGRLFSLTYEAGTAGPNVDSPTVDVSDLDTDDVNVVSDDTDDDALDTHYVVVDSAELLDQFDDHESGDEYVANFTVHGDARDTDLGTDTVSVTDSVSIEESETELDTTQDGAIVLEAAAGQTVTGETNRARDTDFTLRLRSDGVADPFLLESQATVQADGTFRTTVNLSAASPGDNFTVQLVLDGDDVGEPYAGTLVEATATPVTPVSTVTETTPAGEAAPTTELRPLVTDTQTVTSTAEPRTPATTTGSDGPGFTIVGTVLALVVTAVWVRQRDTVR